MDLEKIESLIKLMRSHGLHELKLKENGETIQLTQSPKISAPQIPFSMPTIHTQAEAVLASPVKNLDEQKTKKARENLIEVRSPFVGTYYASSSPGADPFVTVGKTVRKGDTLCIVEAMKLMNEIEAEREGEIVEILVENEQAVEYDQVLFLMK